MSIFGKKETTGGAEEVIPSPIAKRYKLVSMEVKTGFFHIFENEINAMIWDGWNPVGGIDVKSVSVSGWFLTQAMTKE